MNNQIIKINNTDLSVKEFKGQRVVTFKDIDMLHERVEGTAGRNFRDNKKHFVENEDFFFIKPADIGNNEIRRSEINNKGTYLITESGYLMLVKSLQDDLAWKVQRELVNNYFRVKENVQAKATCIEDILIAQLQEMKAVKQTAIEAKEEAVKSREEIQAMREAVTLDTNGWRKETATLINKIANKLGGFEHIRNVREESYKLLNETYGVDINRRLKNKQKNMALEGVSRSKINKVNLLDVITEDKKLLNGYVNIVTKMAIRYGIA